MPPAPASPQRSYRAGRRPTARCQKNLSDPAVHARLVARDDRKSATPRRSRNAAHDLLDGQDHRRQDPRAIAKERNESPIDAAIEIIEERRRRRGLLQYEGERHRGLHAPALGHDLLRRLRRPPAQVRHLPAQDPRVCLREECHPARVRGSLQHLAARRDAGLKDRGLLKPGYFADVLAFDPKTYDERATYQSQPSSQPACAI